MRKINYIGLSDEEIENIVTILDEPVEFNLIRINQKGNKQEVLKKIIESLKYNEKIEANKNFCSRFKIKTRTLTRYIVELKAENKIIANVGKFKNGGRGYIIESIIPEKTELKDEV